jgi:hypothetical protein
MLLFQFHPAIQPFKWKSIAPSQKIQYSVPKNTASALFTWEFLFGRLERKAETYAFQGVVKLKRGAMKGVVSL